MIDREKFKLQFRKAVNEMAKIIGKQAPDVDPVLAFPRIKGFFTVYPEVHMRCLAGYPTRSDVDDFFDFINQDAPDLNDEQLVQMRPIFQRISKTIPPANV